MIYRQVAFVTTCVILGGVVPIVGGHFGRPSAILIEFVVLLMGHVRAASTMDTILITGWVRPIQIQCDLTQFLSKGWPTHCGVRGGRK